MGKKYYIKKKIKRLYKSNRNKEIKLYINSLKGIPTEVRTSHKFYILMKHIWEIQSMDQVFVPISMFSYNPKGEYFNIQLSFTNQTFTGANHNDK